MFYNPDTAFILSQDLFEEAKKLDQKIYMGGALNHQAVAKSILGENNEAILKYEEAIELYVKNGLDEKAAIIYSNLGSVYNGQGDNKKSAEYYFKALSVFEKYEDLLRLASTYNNLGVLYNGQKMYDLALLYYQKSLNIKLKLKDDKEIGLAYLNMGALYGDLKDFEQSKQFYNKAYPFIVKSNAKKELATFYLNMGHLSYNAHEYEKSLENYLKAKKIYEEIDDEINFVITEVHIGGNYDVLGDKEQALKYLTRANEDAKRMQIFSSQLEAAKLLYELYKDEKKYQTALSFNEIYHALNDSLNSIEEQEKTLSLKFDYEYEKIALSDSIEFAKSQEINLLRISKQESQIAKDQIQKYNMYGGIGLMLIFGAFAFRTFQRKKRDHHVITLQHHKLEESHLEIQQSINYSKRLQDVFLPSEGLLSRHFKSIFVFFKPKDVVSGDFYWFEFDEATQTKIIAVADCTGHGVPGALVSIVCSTALNKAVKELGLIEPSDILNKTREIVIDTFTKTGKDVRDGMDITICAIKGNTIKTSGANNGLWLVNSNLELIEYPANRQTVGWQENLNPFTQEEIFVSPGDTIYLLTDGYPDQFGGEKGKKLKKKTLKAFILSIQDQPLKIQEKLLTDKFEAWQGENEQVDDVCLMGIQF